MSVMREIVENSLPVWKECLETDFVKQLVNGSLDEEKFKGYIIEDTLYLREYARVFACTKAAVLKTSGYITPFWALCRKTRTPSGQNM